MENFKDIEESKIAVELRQTMFKRKFDALSQEEAVIYSIILIGRECGDEEVRIDIRRYRTMRLG